MMVPNLTTSAGSGSGIPGPRGPAGADGKDGKSVELAKSSTAIQWRQEGGIFTDLVALSEITGPAGATGPQGPTGSGGGTAVPIDDHGVSGYIDVGTVRMAWGKVDSVLGSPEYFAFPASFGAPPTVTITRESNGAVLVPRQVTKDGFVIDRADSKANPIPLSYTATGITPATVVAADTRFNVVGMPTWSAAVRAQRAGKRNARVLCIGDSTTMGYGANGTAAANNDRAGAYPRHLADILTARGSKGSWQNVIGNGNVPQTAGAYQLYDNRTVWGGTWGPSSVKTLGGYTHRAGAGTPGAMTFTPPEAWDTAEIYFYQGDAYGGTQGLVASVDGVVKSTTTTVYFDTTLGNVQKVTVTADNVGMHVLGMTPAINGVVHVMGFLTYNSNIKEVSVLNGGWGGATAAVWIEGTQAFASKELIKTYNPDLTIINLGINDGTPTDPLLSKVQFKSQIQQLIDAAVSGGSDVMLVAPGDGSPVDYGARYGVLGVGLQELATAQNLPFLNLRTIFGTWAQANANGYMRDAVHHNSAGYQKVATAIADIIMPIGA